MIHPDVSLIWLHLLTSPPSFILPPPPPWHSSHQTRHPISHTSTSREYRHHVPQAERDPTARRWTDDDLEVASAAAIHFIKAFYKSMDNVVERLPVCLSLPLFNPSLRLILPAHLQLLARFYSDRSTMIWNGTKATGMSEIGDLLKDVPPSHSEPLSVDCHPIAGTPLRSPLLNQT